MKKIFCSVILILAVLKMSNSQEGWFILSQSQTSGFSFTDMKFTSSQTGYTTSQSSNGHVVFGGITKTTNGGLNWFSLEQGFAKYGIFFLNGSIGWMTGGYWSDANEWSREVFKTTNGGINFTRTYIDSVHNFFTKIFFADENNGWIISSPQLLRTTNSRVNWTPCLTQQLYSVFFINPVTGWCAGASGFIGKSTNGGLNWISQTIGSGIFREIFFIDEFTGWLCGGSSQIYKSTNSGTSWIPYGSGQFNVNAIEFINHQKGWASGDSGKIVYTTNGGLNWLPQNTGINHGLGMLCFPDSLIGYVRGSKIITVYPPYTTELIFMKTTTGGITFLQNSNSTIPNQFSLSQNYPNPFNPVTIINYELPITNYVKLSVYDVLGKEIAELVNEKQQAGKYQVTWDASAYPSGVYFYRLVVSGAEPLTTQYYSETRKMVLVK